MTEAEARAPVQGSRLHHLRPDDPRRGDAIGPGTIPWSTHLLAWAGYDAAGHGSQSAERMAQRGGFSYREAQCAIAGHYNDCGRCKVEHPPLPGWRPR